MGPTKVRPMNMAEENIFITGGTGLVGSYLIIELLKHTEAKKIYALTRAEKDNTAANRLYNEILAIDPKLNKTELMEKLTCIKGDLSEPQMGIDSSIYNKISSEITCIFNCAACTEFNLPIEELRKTNVKGIDHIAKFAQHCQKNVRINHISSFVVAGRSKGTWSEDDLDKGQTFNNNYEQSKFEAEMLIEKWRKKGLNINVFRLGVVVGDSRNGYTNNFKMLYQPIRLFSLQILKKAPVNKKASVPICPIDFAVNAIRRIDDKITETKSLTYHVFSPERVRLITIFDKAAKFFNYNNPGFIESDKFSFDDVSKKQLTIVRTYFNYGSYDLMFTSNNTKKILGNDFTWPKIDNILLNKLFTYCLKSNYIKKKQTNKPFLLDNQWVVIAAYNEEQGLKELLPELKKFCSNILVVNDGSTDKTTDIAKENTVNIIENKINSGKGYALKSAFNFLVSKDFDFVLLLDADGQHRPQDMELFYQKAKENNLDLVIGNRMHNTTSMPRKRRFLNKFYSRVISFLCKQQYPDVLCGYRIIRKELLQKLELQTNGFEIDAELLLQSRKHNAAIDFVDIPCIYKHETSHLNLFKDTAKIAKFTFPYLIQRIRRCYP